MSVDIIFDVGVVRYVLGGGRCDCRFQAFEKCGLRGMLRLLVLTLPKIMPPRVLLDRAG